jgi:anion-transporting  ArsA/GET3 family ATPase
VRLHVVTGKGGTGKTTVAAALALALASGGRRVLLAEVEGRQSIAQLFDCPPLPYDERKVAVAPRGGDVYALAVDAEDALIEYLEMFYNLKRAGRALKKFGAVDFATTIAPGMRDVLLTGKVVEAVKRREKQVRPTYDAVVMDAPPTGRIVRFLNVNAEVAGLARGGPIRHHADSVMSVIRSPQTAIHIVTLLEEMPVQETIDGVAELQAAKLPVGAVVINMTRPPLLPTEAISRAARGDLDTAEIAQGLKEAGIEPTPDLLDGLVAEAVEHANRVELEQRERIALGELGRATYELPLLSEAVDLGGLYKLAEMLIEQGMVPR